MGRNIAAGSDTQIGHACMFCCCSMLISTGVHVELVDDTVLWIGIELEDVLLTLQKDTMNAMHQRRLPH